MTFVLFIFMIVIIAILIIILPFPAGAAFEKTESGAAALSMGNAWVAVPHPQTALFYNPAGIDSIGSFSTYMSYRTFYGLPEIRQYDMTLSANILNHPVALGTSLFGTNDYSELQILAGSAYDISAGIRMGISFQYYLLSISGYGADYTFGINWGIQYAISPVLICAAMVSNINKPLIGRIKEKLPQSFGLGLCYFPARGLIISTEVYHDIRFDQDFRLGISYQFDYPIIIRIGFQDGVNCYGIGLGTKVNSLCFDYAVQIHTILGVSHIFSFSIQL